MMFDRFDGDPKLIMTDNGVDMQYVEGQPLMDAGFENQTQISLFTETGWVGNIFFDNEKEKIGSTFETTAKGNLTLSKLEEIRKIVEKDLENDAFESVTASVSNPSLNYIKVSALIKPKGQDSQSLLFLKNGLNWLNQANNPSYRRVI